MKNRLAVFLIFAISISVAGCAPHFGRDIHSTTVKFFSEPSGLNFYLISSEQNKALTDGFSPVPQNQLPRSILSEGTLDADGPRYVLEQGKFFIVWRCGKEFRRKAVHLQGDMNIRFDCR